MPQKVEIEVINSNKTKQMNTKKLVLGVLSGLLIAGFASAAVLSVYVTLTGSLNDVQQAVVFGNGDTSKTFEINNAVAGNTYNKSYILKNRSESTAPIEFVTTEDVGITTTYWSSVDLRKKDANWSITGDAIGTLTYQLNANTFNYDFTASNLTPETSYSLIYYADKQERMTNWGGDNPGSLLGTFTTDVTGSINSGAVIDLGMNLPATSDWNGSSDANYCTDLDNYDLCRGAKIWLVPSTAYDTASKKLISWNPEEYLFETDLITYDDTDFDGVSLNLGKGTLNFFAKNELDISLDDGDYTIITEIKPVVVD
jgi:hypothetical protein